MEGNKTESVIELNKRYADGLLPLTVTFGVFVVVGSIGNVLILLVFSLSKEYRKNNFKIFVICLALIDLITCLTLIPAEMAKHRNYFSFDDGILCKVKCFFNVFGACSSSLALLIISIDRFRRVCQPLRRQISPSLAVKLLIAFAFVFPFILAVPGPIMCGIAKTNKTNIYGGSTEIYLCGSEEKFRKSLLRKMYKLTFVILLVGISLTYIVLYSFVMKEVVKQIKSISRLRKSSLYEVCYSSDIHDPNSIATERAFSKTSEDESFLAKHFSKGDSIKKIRNILPATRQPSTRSVGVQGQPIRRLQFPYKTLIWFILTILFIVTYILNVILTLNVANFVEMSTTQFAVYSFFYRIYFLNHVLNPFVYLIFLKSFRSACRSLFPTIKSRVRDICRR